jgi:hypothetical protein
VKLISIRPVSRVKAKVVDMLLVVLYGKSHFQLVCEIRCQTYDFNSKRYITREIINKQNGH